MEASPAQPPPPPPPTQAPPTAPEDDRAGAGWRLAAVVLSLALAIVAAVGIAVMTDVSDVGVCEEASFGSECYDFSESAKPFVLVFGWAGSVLAALAALGALAFAIRGRGGRPMLIGTGIAVALLAISIIIARVA